MPVRSNGRLLAGTVAVFALGIAGPGCQSQLIRPATMNSPTPAIAATSASTPVATAAATRTTTPVATTPVVVAKPPIPASRFSFFRRARPVEMQAPVAQSADRRAPAAQGMAIIASSFRPINRDTPAPASVVEKPAASATTADASIQQTGGRGDDAAAKDSPWHPAVLAASESTGRAEVTAVSNPPPAETTTTPRLVPQPVLPAGTLAPAIVRAHYRYPGHTHEAAPPPVPAVPREFEKQALPPYVVEPPDILLINASNAITLPTQQLRGQHLVRPDGTINLGIYGSVFVAGLTLDQIQDIVAQVLKARHARKRGEDNKPTEQEMTVDEIKSELQVDVLAYNSKVYYIVTDGGGYGEQVFRISATGNETVLDALSQINGLPAVASKKKIWVARATPDHSQPIILPVDWRGIVKNGSAETNYQIFPGDRIYVNSDALIRTDSALGKFLAPVERVLGTVLLGSSAVNSIKNTNGTGTGNGIP